MSGALLVRSAGKQDPRRFAGCRTACPRDHEEKFVETTGFLVDVTVGLPGDHRALKAMTRDQLEEQTRASHKLVRRAILEGQWPLLERRRLQGQTYARLGVRLEDWFVIAYIFQSIVTDLLAKAYAAEPWRLARAVAGRESLPPLGMKEMARAYLDAVEGNDQLN